MWYEVRMWAEGVLAETLWKGPLLVYTLIRKVPKPICGIAEPAEPDAKGSSGIEYCVVFAVINM